jgi:hypothetical protein
MILGNRSRLFSDDLNMWLALKLHHNVLRLDGRHALHIVTLPLHLHQKPRDVISGQH